MEPSSSRPHRRRRGVRGSAHRRLLADRNAHHGVHLAADEAHRSLRSGDLHRYVGSGVFSVAPEEVTPDSVPKVRQCPTAWHTACRFGLANQLNISSDETGELRTNCWRFRTRRTLPALACNRHTRTATPKPFSVAAACCRPGLASTVARHEAAERAALNADSGRHRRGHHQDRHDQYSPPPARRA